MDDFSFSGTLPQWLTLLVATGGMWIAINQFKLNRKQLKDNHEWNRRQLASTESNKILSEVTMVLKDIDKDVKYTERKATAPYTVEEIHKAFCKANKDGEMIQSSDKQSLIIDEEKRYIRTGILSILNKFDYLAGGVNNGVFDEFVIKKNCQGMMIKAFIVFKSYITHLREFYKRDTLFEDLEHIVSRWESEKSSAKKAELTGG